MEPLNKETAPNDIHEFFGFKLPDEVYFYMCHGLISPQVLSSLISGYIIENQPLTNTDTLDYTNFIKSPQIAELRVQSASLLSYNTNKFFINRKLSSVYWFDPKVEIPLSLSDTHATCEKWLIESASRVPTVANTTSWVSEAKKKQQFSTNNNSVDVRFCLKTIQALAKVASGGRVDTINPSVLNTPQLPKSDHDILALVIVRFLELRHFTQQSQLITPYGQALLKGLTIPAATTSSSSSSPSSPINSDELILALELLRLEQLSSTPYTVPRVIPKPGDISSDSKEAKHITLISRVVSLVPFLKAAFPPFPGPLSRDLAAFNSFVRTVHRSLRNTMEMLVLSFMVSERPSKKEKDLDVASYVKLAPKLLFFTESGTAMGLVMKSYLTRLVKLEIGGISSATGDAPPMKTSDAVIRAKKATADIYGPASALDFNEQWSRAILFWNQVVEVVKSLNTGSSGKEKEVYDSFLEAEAWFSTRR